jgi:hypothetical protein
VLRALCVFSKAPLTDRQITDHRSPTLRNPRSADRCRSPEDRSQIAGDHSITDHKARDLITGHRSQITDHRSQTAQITDRRPAAGILHLLHLRIYAFIANAGIYI